MQPAGNVEVAGAEGLVFDSARGGHQESGEALDLDCLQDEAKGQLFRWDPLSETRAAAYERIMQVVRSDVRQALARIDAEWERAGAVRTPVKRQPEHFEWLARYQVLRETYDEIAGREHA